MPSRFAELPVHSAARRLVPALFCAGLFVGCQGAAPRTPPHATPAIGPVVFSDAGEGAVPAAWWTHFGDPALDAVVADALASNPGLAEAAARCRRAHALARLEGAARSPTLDAVGDAEGVVDRATRGGRLDSDRRLTSGLGVEAGYELDLWGRLRSLHDAARFEAIATGHDLAAARIAVAGSLATAWFRRVAAMREGALLEEQLRTNVDLLEVVRHRFDSGQAIAPDVLRQEQLIERTKAEVARNVVERELLEHQINVLRGQAPREPLPESPADLPELAAVPETGVPAERLSRRPDVAAALARIRSADRDLAAAIADRAPRVRLGASLLFGGPDLEDLFREWAAALAYQLTGPLADGGARDAAVDAAHALRDQRLAAYADLLLRAALDVEDALRAERLGRDVLERLERQHELALQTVESLTTRYGQAASDYFEVLAAIEAEQALARGLVDQRATLVERRVQLLRALAGPVEDVTDTLSEDSGS